MPSIDGLAPAPKNFFMTIRDIAFWIRSARADARLDRFRQDPAHGSAFDKLYAHTDDPFGAELKQYRYQQRKYNSLLSMLPQRPYRKVLDIGCGRGAFARKLAPFAEHVLGTDISAEAIAQARKLSGGHPNVAYAQQDMMDSSQQDAAFDLIVVADTIYYLGLRSSAGLKAMVSTISSRLAPQGLVLIVNHYFFGIDRASKHTREIHDAFRWAPSLECVVEYRRAFYLATLLQRSPS
jgi:predicted TPR repeat methyltransferase